MAAKKKTGGRKKGTPSKAKPGRPTKYTKGLAGIICERLAGGESLRAVCADEAMPCQTTVFAWLGDETKAEFLEQYAHAREVQTETLADEILDIADDASNDFMERARADGSTETVLNAEHVQRSRLRVETRKWLLAKLQPKKYGDRLDLALSGNLALTHEEALDELDGPAE